MKTRVDCISCKVRQAVDVIKRSTDDPILQEKALKEMLRIICGLSFDRPPVAVRRDVEIVVKKMLGMNDPYQQHKEFSNQIGQMLYPELKKTVRESDNPLQSAIRLAVTGNIIDFGMFRFEEVDEEKIRATVDLSGRNSSAVDDSDALIERMHEARNIWYIADNCGELFFDRVLLEEIPAKEITMVVRGKPILNDATLEDAEFAGLAEYARLVDDGYDAPALILDKCLPEIREGFLDADLVISKGQGNYESLSEVDREVFFLLMVKCDVVAKDIGCNVGDVVIKRHLPGLTH
jgi:uncharacterized protein with ATP-grasp and redox domains